MTKGLVVTTAVVYARVDKASSRTLLTIVVHVNKRFMAKYRPTFMTTFSRSNVKFNYFINRLTVLSVFFFSG